MSTPMFDERDLLTVFTGMALMGSCTQVNALGVDTCVRNALEAGKIATLYFLHANGSVTPEQVKEAARTLGQPAVGFPPISQNQSPPPNPRRPPQPQAQAPLPAGVTAVTTTTFPIPPGTQPVGVIAPPAVPIIPGSQPLPIPEPAKV